MTLPPVRFLLEGDAADPVVVVRSRFWRFNAIGVFDGDEACVVDPGIYPDEIDALRMALGRPVTHVALTHSHHDHIRGWMRFPGARIVGAKNTIDTKLGIDDPEYRYPEADATFEQTYRFNVGAHPVEMRFLPGHSNCTSVVLFPTLGTLCTADYLVSPGLPYCRWEARAFEEALETLERWCEEESVTRILPAHEHPILGKNAIRAAIDEERQYFRFLREHVRADIAAGNSQEACVRRAARALGERRGVDLGGRARQDIDNARRVFAEEASII